jgi:hypothetical protein
MTLTSLGFDAANATRTEFGAALLAAYFATRVGSSTAPAFSA